MLQILILHKLGNSELRNVTDKTVTNIRVKIIAGWGKKFDTVVDIVDTISNNLRICLRKSQTN